MKNFRFPAMVLAVLAAAVACQKDDQPAPGNSTLTKMRAKWNVQNIVMDFPDDAYDSTYTGQTSDYLDFRADNKVYTQIDGDKDTLVYTLVNDNTLVVDGDTTSIQQLTGSQFTIRETFVEAGDTSVVTYHLNK